MNELNTKLKKYKLKINILNIVIICLILICGLALFNGNVLVIVVGVIFIKLLWDQLENLIDNYNFLIYQSKSKYIHKPIRNIDTSSKKISKSSYCNEYENKEAYDFMSEYCCEVCGKPMSMEEYEENNGCCEECYNEINIHYENNGLDDFVMPYKDIIDDPDMYKKHK